MEAATTISSIMMILLMMIVKVCTALTLDLSGVANQDKQEVAVILQLN